MNRRVERIGPHTLILGDAYAVAPGLGHFDACAADPQYKFDNSGGGRYRKARHASNALVELGLDQGFDMRLLKPALADAVVVFCHNDQLPELLTYLTSIYARFALCFWRKTNPQPVHNKHYLPDFEPYVHAWLRHAHPIGNYEDARRCWDGSVSRGGEGRHPTIKPLALMRKIVRNMSGETILDPFMGTGSTGVAAAIEGRVFTGIEIDPHWFEVACRRLEAVVRGQPDPLRDAPPRPAAGPADPGGGPLFMGEA